MSELGQKRKVDQSWFNGCGESFPVKLTIEASLTTTLMVYPDINQVVWVLGGANKKTFVTTLPQAEVMFRAEYYRRTREMKKP